MGEDGLNAMFVPELRRLKGQALRRVGQLQAARRELQLSLAITQAQGALLLALRAALALYGVLCELDLPGDAKARLEDALSGLPEGCEHLPEAKQAAALLA